MKTSPLQSVKERFGDKQKLVSAVKALATDDLWLAVRHGDTAKPRVNPEKGLDSVSNAKLLRLHDTLSRVKKEFGNRAKLIAAILTSSKRDKDTGFKSKLENLPTPELVDIHGSSARRAKASEKKTKKAPAKKAPAAKKKAARTKKAKAKAKAAPKK